MTYRNVRRQHPIAAGHAVIVTSDGLPGDTTQGRENDTSSHGNEAERKKASQQEKLETGFVGWTLIRNVGNAF